MADVLAVKQHAVLERRWQHAQRSAPYIEAPHAFEPREEPRAAPPTLSHAALAAASAALPAAGKPSDVSEADGYDTSLPTPCEVIGGIARLHDVASARYGERLHRPNGAADPAANPYAPLVDGDVNRGNRGGWIPAEPGMHWEPSVGGVTRHHVGFREGSALWKQHQVEAANRSAARTEMRLERERSQRFLGRREEEAEVEETAHERAYASASAAATRAVSAQRATTALHAYAEAPPGWPPNGNPAVGYRPGSAAARRAAGGLYEGPGAYRGSHSQRLTGSADERARKQEHAAFLAVNARREAERSEDIAADLAMVRRELAAERMVQTNEFSGHAERVAARQSINMKLNMALAGGRRGRWDS